MIWSSRNYTFSDEFKSVINMKRVDGIHYIYVANFFVS